MKIGKTNVITGLNYLKNQDMEKFLDYLYYGELRLVFMGCGDRRDVIARCDNVEEFLQKIKSKIITDFDAFAKNNKSEDVYVVMDNVDYLLTPENQALMSYEIINLMKEGYNFILSTNSAHVMHALNDNSEENDLNGSFRFFIYDKNKIEDATQNKGYVFKLFSYPIEDTFFKSKWENQNNARQRKKA